MALMSKADNKSTGEGVEELEHAHIAGSSGKWHGYFRKQLNS
jgi:hypothetical protein